MKRYMKCLFLLFFLSGLLLPLNLSAQEILTWQDCVNEARQNNPDLISGIEKLTQVKTNLTQARSNFLPQINGSASTQESKSDGSNKTESYSYGVSGRQLLFDGFKTNYDIATASETVKQSLYDYAVTSSNVRLKLRQAFVNLMKAQESVNITKEIAERRRQNVELVTLSYKAGREHKGSLLTAQADLAEAEFEMTRANRDIELAQRQLIKELGRINYVPLRLKGNLDIPITGEEKPDFEQITDNTPLLKELIAQMEIARLGVKSAKADFYPQVYASASAARSASSWPPDESRWSLGVSLSLPIFSGGSRLAGVSRAESVLRKAQVDKASGRAEIILTLAENWNNFQDALGQISVQEKFVAATEERAKIAESQYKIGLISFDNWIIIEDALINTKKALLNTQANALLAEANWMQAKGVTLNEN